MLDTKPGRYGLHLARDAHDITLLDVVEAVRPLSSASVFGVERPLSGTCTIADNIFEVLTAELDAATSALHEQLAATSLHELAWKLPATYDVPVEEKLETIHENLRKAAARTGSAG